LYANSSELPQQESEPSTESVLSIGVNSQSQKVNDMKDIKTNNRKMQLLRMLLASVALAALLVSCEITA
jgi:hypothetical protein